MTIEMREVDSKEIWESFLQITAPHSFLQSWSWGELNQKLGHRVIRCGFYDQQGLCATALLVVIHAKRGSFLFCPHGPCLQPGLSIKDFFPHFRKILTLIAKTERCSFIRISSLFPNTLEYTRLFKEQGFRNAPIHMMHPEHSLLLNLQPSEDELLANMRKTTRYSIKKAEKEGVVIIQTSDIVDIEKFWKVYEATAARQQFTAFSKSYVVKELQAFGQDDKIQIFLAEYQHIIIAAAIIVFDGHSAYYHHGASDQQFLKIPAAYLLQWKAIQEAKRRGCLIYNFYGVVREDQPKHPWAGLSLFKRGFGGQEESYLHAQDLPLNWKYWIVYGVETIRRIHRGL